MENVKKDGKYEKNEKCEKKYLKMLQIATFLIIPRNFRSNHQFPQIKRSPLTKHHSGKLDVMMRVIRTLLKSEVLPT